MKSRLLVGIAALGVFVASTGLAPDAAARTFYTPGRFCDLGGELGNYTSTFYCSGNGSGCVVYCPMIHASTTRDYVGSYLYADKQPGMAILQYRSNTGSYGSITGNLYSWGAFADMSTIPSSYTIFNWYVVIVSPANIWEMRIGDNVI